MYITYFPYIMCITYANPERTMTTLTVTSARQHWSELVDSVAFKGQRVRLQRNGRDVAALVSAEDADLLELLEDKTDLDEVKRRLSDGKEPLAYEDIRAQLGLA